MKPRAFLYSFLLIVLSATSNCKTLSSSKVDSSEAIQLSKLEKIPLNSTQEEVEGILGKPRERVSIADSAEDVGWVYFDDKNEDRATLVFNKSTRKLGAKTWLVKDGDSERRVEVALKRYPSARFKKREAEWVNPHIAPDEYYYEDPDLNLSIEVRFTRNEVTFISWYLPDYAPKPKKCVKFQTSNGLISCKPK